MKPRFHLRRLLAAWLFLAAIAAAQEGVRLEQLQRAVRDRPDDVPARVNLGVALYLMGDPDGAIVQFREAIRRDPQYAPAYRHLGVALMRLGQLSAAETPLRDALRLNPRLVQARCDLAVLLASSRNLEGAERMWLEALAADRNAVAEYAGHARDAAEREDFLRAKPEAIAVMLVARTLRDTGDRSRAMSELHRAARTDAGFALPQALLCELFAAASKDREADAACTEAARRQPGLQPSLDAMRKKVAAEREADDKLKSASISSEVDAVKRMIPNLLLVPRLRSASDQQIQRSRVLLAEAARRLSAALEKTPGDTGALLLLGAALRELDETRAATRTYRRLLDLPGIDGPTAAQGWLGLGLLEARAGREREALELYARGLIASPGDADLLSETAWIYAASADASLRNPEAALNWAQRAVDQSRNRNPAHLRVLAEAQWASGRADDARKTIRRAIDIAPDDRLLREQLDRYLSSK